MRLVGGLRALFNRHPQVAFCHWQDDAATRGMIESEVSVVLVAEFCEGIVGAVFGGILGSRATINHLAVDEAVRNRSLTSRIVDRACEAIRATGVQRVFLFVADENDLGHRVLFPRERALLHVHDLIANRQDPFRATHAVDLG